ncbi:MAG TPA: hypothetical protein VLT33_20160 [Labilithrix sp.]|nr:hypothetical protein [Labilithrix sp.]
MKRHAWTLVGSRLALGVATASVAALAVLTPSAAQAQDPPAVDSAAEARQQYAQGTQAFQAKHYEEAALHFEAAASFRTNAVALYTAALAWDLATKPERAADAYGRALAVGGLEPKQSNLAKDRVAQLEKTLGTVVVTAPEGWRVQLDTFTEVLTPARLHGSTGVRSLSIRAPGRPIERRDVTLEASKLSNLELKDEPKVVAKVEPEPVKPAPVVVAPPPRRVESYWITRRVIGVGVGGVGLAALAGGIVLGLQANGAKDAYDAGPTRESFDHASALQTWTNVSLIAGGVLIAGGIALVVIPDGDEGRVRASLTPGGAVVSGSF